MKRIVGGLLVAVLMIFFVACGVPGTQQADPPVPSPTVAATSRDAHSEPVRVDETYAMADVTDASPTPAAATAAPAGSAPTPATGDAPVVYIIGTVGLILFCSAGLLLLKRI